MRTPMEHPAVTALGLLLAVFGTSLILEVLPGAEIADLSHFLVREGLVFLLLGALLLLIRYGEQLPFSSIGWHTDRLSNAALWGLLGIVAVYAAIIPCLLLAQHMHWRVGAQVAPRFHPPLWAATITMFRAGITEEAFRAYGLERLISITGRRWLALMLVTLPFAVFHFHQGPAGILIAWASGLVLSLIYLYRRSLPAVMLAHFGVDFIPNVLLPLFGADLG
jgi:membrane protease YdiL (CAAX protease family)